MVERVWDVAVVGAGPAGSSAAIAAARAGASTVILDRALFPRYKTCGGGLIGPTLGSLPADFAVPAAQLVDRISFTRRGAHHVERRSDGPMLTLVNRAEFDAALLDRARAEGAEVRTGVLVTGVREAADVVEIATAEGPVKARYVIGADGSASRVARHVGVELAQIDLGLEIEVLDPTGGAWAGRVHLDWGPIPGSYAWVFPKGRTLTVGVIARKGAPEQTRAYLRDFTGQMGLTGAQVVEDSGHLTRCRTPGSPLATPRVLVAGDAAGLLEPWTREGISFAVRSGRAAGEAVTSGLDDVASLYRDSVTSTLGREMSAGALFLTLFERHPALIHLLLTRTPLGWNTFRRCVSGDTTLASLAAHRPVPALVRALT